MFTIEQIELAHQKVATGADFPGYIQEIKKMGVKTFQTWVKDSHTQYFGENGNQTQSKGQYEELIFAGIVNQESFKLSLKIHQEGETDYLTFCQHCADAGIEKWIVDLENMTCTYYDIEGSSVLVESIPQ